MKFKEFEIKDIENIKNYIAAKGENCCDTALANLMVWQGVYHNRFCEEDGVLYLRSGESPDYKYSLPFCRERSRTPSCSTGEVLTVERFSLYRQPSLALTVRPSSAVRA